MQSSLYSVSSNSTNLHFSWVSRASKLPSPQAAKPVSPKTILKPFTVSNSVKTSFNFRKDFDFKEENQNLKDQGPVEGQLGISYRLPIVIRNSSTVLRYFWDGSGLKLVSLDGNSFCFWDSCVDFEDAARKFVRICSSVLRNFFLPREVSGNYTQYVKWKFLHRVFSSALQVLATQAMFRAIGIGYKRSLPSAAALNWVLKDGLGRLSRCIYTASLASAFDTNLKRVRFSTSVLFSLSIGVELLTPVFPSYFLLLASVANIAKQISLACYLATGTAVHRSFAVTDNLGEVSAKAQIQTVCFDNLGLVVAALLNIVVRNNQRLQAALPFVVYPIFSAIDLFGIYQGLKHVHLQTLTKQMGMQSHGRVVVCEQPTFRKWLFQVMLKHNLLVDARNQSQFIFSPEFHLSCLACLLDRLEIIINSWIQQGYVPSRAEVSKEEGINFLWTKGRKTWPIRIGCLNLRGQLPELAMLTMQALNNEDFYFICMENFNNGLTRIGQKEKLLHGIVLCIREGACSSDVMTGLLQACYIRKALLSSRNQYYENIVEPLDCSNPSLQEWFKLIEDSKQLAQENVNLLIEEMSAMGWACKNVLLTATEQTRYSFVAD